MSRLSLCVLSMAAVGAALALPVYGQTVVSTHSGVVHFFEGTVSVAGQPLESRFGKFATIPDGAELRTEQGRAEILLTPGVILRVGEKSAIRMTATALSDTRVEILAGSALLESSEPAAGTAVTITFKNWKIEQPHQGAYRIDCEPPRLHVREGEVKVAATGGDAPALVAQGMDLPFEAVLVPEKSAPESHDALSDWAEGRSESISADNAIAADIQDPATMNNVYGLADDFTYFPMLGYPSLGTLSGGAGLYGTANPLYQPGFYSIYLPGYTYRPMYLRIPSTGIGRSLYLPTASPLRYGTPGSTLAPARAPIGAHPVTPVATPHPTVVAHPVIIHK